MPVDAAFDCSLGNYSTPQNEWGIVEQLWEWERLGKGCFRDHENPELFFLWYIYTRFC